jgi:hypothetical protein
MNIDQLLKEREEKDRLRQMAICLKQEEMAALILAGEQKAKEDGLHGIELGYEKVIALWKKRVPYTSIPYEIHTLWQKWGFKGLFVAAHQKIHGEDKVKLLRKCCDFCGGPVPCLRTD